MKREPSDISRTVDPRWNSHIGRPVQHQIGGWVGCLVEVRDDGTAVVATGGRDRWAPIDALDFVEQRWCVVDVERPS